MTASAVARVPALAVLALAIAAATTPSANAQCRRPVAVLARVVDADNKVLAGFSDSAYADLGKALQKGGVEIVDVSEFSADFKNLTIQALCSVGSTCKADDMTFAEAASRILKDLRIAAEKAREGDPNFRSAQKLLRLFPDGALMTATFTLAPTRGGAVASVVSNTKLADTSDQIWKPQSMQLELQRRQLTDEQLVEDMLAILASDLANEIAKGCKA